MLPSNQLHLYSDTGKAIKSWGMLLVHQHGLPEIKHSILHHTLDSTMMNKLRHVGHWCQGLTAYSTSSVASTAGCNGDRESDCSVNTTGPVACLVELLGFVLMRQRDTAS